MNNKQNKSIKSLEEYEETIKELTKNGSYIYRGQRKVSYPLSSSGVRRLENSGFYLNNNTHFIACNCDLIKGAKEKGYHKNEGPILTDLELLAKLQHNGAATCLIDFSENHRVALFFALNGEENYDENSVVYILDSNDKTKFRSIKNSERNKRIEELLDEKSEYLWVWKPQNFINRIISQSSVFVFGKCGIDEEYVYSKIEIDKNSRFSILKELRDNFKLDETSIYDDLTGFAKANGVKNGYFPDKYLEIMSDLFDQFFIMRNYEKTRDIIDNLKNCNFLSREGLAISSYLYFIEDKFEDSINELEKLIIVNPNLISNQFFIGLIKHFSNDYNGAKKHYKNALNLINLQMNVKLKDSDIIKHIQNNIRRANRKQKPLTSDNLKKYDYWTPLFRQSED